MNCFFILLYICLFCVMLIYGHSYLLHGLSFVRRVCGCVPHCGYVLCPIGGDLSHCGYVLCPIVIILSLGVKSKWFMYVIFLIMFHSQCSIVYCVYYFIDTKNLPTDFHWSMGSGAYPTLCIVGYGGMSVCRHCA